MTAVLHTIELFIPGTTNPTDASRQYHIPSSPIPVTVAERRRLVRRITYEQRIWSLLVVSAGLIYGLMMVYSARQRGLDVAIQRESLRPVLIAAILFLGYLQVHFSHKRKFVLSAPATTAEIVEENRSAEGAEESGNSARHLALRYTPLPVAGSKEQYTMLDGPALPAGWADLDGFSARFEHKVHAGDLVSILYDPDDPAHVRVVEP